MRNNIDELLEEEARIRQQEEDEIRENPLMQYSTSQLKAELRRRKKGAVLGMAKAVLVMDMPESCFGCNFLYCDGDTNLDSCQAREKARPVDSETYKKPDWCPLQELPEKIPELKSGYESINRTLHREGWNACLDEILK